MLINKNNKYSDYKLYIYIFEQLDYKQKIENFNNVLNDFTTFSKNVVFENELFRLLSGYE